MQNEQWENLIDSLEIKFGKLERKRRTTVTTNDIGHEIKNEEEWLEFETPSGKMRLSRITRPMIIDKKFHYTHTAKAKGKVEYVLSETEKSYRVVLSQWNSLNNDWQEVQAPNGNLKF
jgi:hypothetical protein